MCSYERTRGNMESQEKDNEGFGNFEFHPSCQMTTLAVIFRYWDLLFQCGAPCQPPWSQLNGAYYASEETQLRISANEIAAHPISRIGFGPKYHVHLPTQSCSSNNNNNNNNKNSTDWERWSSWWLTWRRHALGRTLLLLRDFWRGQAFSQDLNHRN